MTSFVPLNRPRLDRLRGAVLGAALSWVFAHSGSADAAASPKLQFNRDIRPILADNCLACHGPDPGARKAGLRLDTREGIFEPGPKHGPLVLPGDPEKSPLWERVSTSDEDDLMPPPKSNKALKPEQKELLKRWIEEGATWQGHWAFIKPERPTPPPVRDTQWVRNPIDAFILARLEAKGLTPAPEADRRTLARRLSLDLTGLPPRPDAVERFVKDRAPDAYDQFVRRLLASPTWGEHRARYWLDAARYADTHGLHFDNYREMWPYRDYVIRAFNRNLPFDRFVIEQLAGDLLEHPTDEELVATGFQRCNMTTNEGGTIEDENLANYANDRVTTTGWVFLGLTANCASCHDHKFDPFTTRDFYSLSAFFRNTTQTGFDRNYREGDLSMVVPQTDKDRTRWKALPAEIETANAQRDQAQAAADQAFTNWVTSIRPDQLPREVHLESEVFRLPLTEGSGTTVVGRVEGRRRQFSGPERLEWRGGPLGPAPILTKTNAFLIGDVADFDAVDAFSISAWVWVPEGYDGEGSVVARMAGPDGHHRGWDLFVRKDHFGMHLVHRWPAVAVKVRAPDKTLAQGQWQHLGMTYDGSTRADGVKLYLNGLEVQGNHDQNRLEGSTRSGLPLRVGRREQGNELDGVAVQDVRLAARRWDPAEVAALAAAPRAAEWLAGVEFTRTNNPAREVMRRYYRATQDRDWRKSTARLAALEAERIAIRGRSPVTHIQREKQDSVPTAHVLYRGQYDQPKDLVPAATPAALHAWPSGAPTNRLGLAQWLVSPENPLTARVTVNRFWQEAFGDGIVRTADDFGVMGENPVHPELLDWLAVEFRASGWDIRHLFTLMVTSATYRQSAATTPRKLELDPQNRWLSRGPRFRMDAEMIRDYALATSDLLVPKVGGPSVKPYQPDGVWEAVAMPESNTRHYTRDTGDALYRRSLYTFWKRAAPPASLEILNAPSRETCIVRRERTDTPLQALATLNDPQFVEAARHLASLAYRQSRGRLETAAAVMAERLLARPLAPPELGIVEQTLTDSTAFYRQHPAEADRLVTVGDSPPPAKIPAPELAALTVLANQLLNLDEVLNK